MGRTTNPNTVAGVQLSSDIAAKGDWAVVTETGYYARSHSAAGAIQGRFVGKIEDYTDTDFNTQTGDGSKKLTMSTWGLQQNVPITGATRAKVGDPVYLAWDGTNPALTMTKSGMEIGVLFEFRDASHCDLIYSSASDILDSEIYPAVADEGVATNVYAITTIPAVTTLKTGQIFTVLAPNADNTGASTLNVCGLGATAIVDGEGNALRAGAIVTSMPMYIIYNGTNFTLMNDAIETTHKANKANILVATDAGAVNAHVVTTDPVIALAAGLELKVLAPAADNTGPVTLSYNGTVGDVVDGEGNALRPGDILTSAPMVVIFDGTNWVLQNPQTLVSKKTNFPPVMQVIDTGVAKNVYVCAATVPPIALEDGMLVILRGINANSDAACTFNFQGGGALAIVDGDGAAISAADLITTAPAMLLYQSGTTNWVLLNPATTCY